MGSDCSLLLLPVGRAVETPPHGDASGPSSRVSSTQTRAQSMAEQYSCCGAVSVLAGIGVLSGSFEHVLNVSLTNHVALL